MRPGCDISSLAQKALGRESNHPSSVFAGNKCICYQHYCNGKHGVNFFSDLIENVIILFVNNNGLVSETPRGLQQHLDLVAKNCKLSVNLEKSNVFSQ